MAANTPADIVFLNGEFLNKDQAKVSIFDRGFIFGDGIYEVVPVINSKLVDREAFWARFERSLSQIDMKLPLPKEQYEEILYKLIEKNGIKEGGIYTQVTRGVAYREFKFLPDIKQTIMAYTYESKVFDNPKATTGIKVVTSDDIRWKRRDIKSISLLAQCYAKNIAAKADADECLMVEDGFVTEGSSSSVFIIKNGELITRPLSNSILPGIRRNHILSFASEAGLKPVERNFTLDEVYGADEVFISAATLILLPVISVDDKLINSGKIGEYSKKLREIYINRFKKEAGLI